MNQTNSAAKSPRSILTIILAAVLLSTATLAADDTNPYYGFFPSSLGEDYKKLTHNIFGFSIDMPSNWIFGVNGTPPLAVVILYPEGVNQSTFSKEYETIEIGQLPPNASNLDQARDTIMNGMRAKHPDLTVTTESENSTLNGKEAMCWTFEWKSAKTGYTVMENVHLVQSPSGIRSLTVRTSRGDFPERTNYYRNIVNTFTPFTPKY